MRPIAVSMVGFGTFSDAVTVDFEGVDVFALVGPTGSGKSTVIDAICFALYGTIPRYDDRRAVGAAVNALATEARVSLTFELGGAQYVAVRVVRRDSKGKASTKEARLERGDGEVLAGTAREMETVVPQLLGLGFEQFTRAVVLPQGDFARFLHDKPAARQDLLVQLLGLDVYERMMQRARGRAAETTASLARDRERISALSPATPAARAALAARAEACASARANWRLLKPELDAGRIVAEAADGAAATAHDRVQRLSAIAAPEDLGVWTERISETAAAVAAAELEVEHLAAAVLAADAAFGAGGDREVLNALLAAHELVVSLGAEVPPLVDALAEAKKEATIATGAAEGAAAHADQLRTASAADVVREHLVVGAACPVCEQIVELMPPGVVSTPWRDARVAAETARAESDLALKRLARAEDRTEDLAARLVRARADVADVQGPHQIAAELLTIDGLAARATTVRQDEQLARGKLRTVREQRDDAARFADRARDQYRSQRDQVSAVGLLPPPETDNIGLDWSMLVSWAETERTRLHDEVIATKSRAEAARAALRVQLQAVAAVAVELALVVDSPSPSIDELLEAVAVEGRVAQDALVRLDAEIAERTALIDSVGQRAGDAEVAGELARLLDANHFERWLVSVALSRLVEGGTARLHDLSSGRYSFAFDDSGRDLLVVDHNQGDERRSVRTLSGGETFQASLALALALSDQLSDLAADGAARLESIFLDEGFGTLDAETLDMVAGTIENLGAAERMVGIVTHVPELAARMPVQFRVTKGARSSQVERVAT